MTEPAINQTDDNSQKADGAGSANVRVEIGGAPIIVTLILVALCAGFSGWAVATSSDAHKIAETADMNYTLAYTHLVNMDAYLNARGVPTEKFGPLSKPKKGK